MKKYGLWLIVMTVTLMSFWAPSKANATVSTETGALNPDWTPWPSVGGGVVEFEARLGNLGLSGDWELGHKFDGTYLDSGGQFAITNGNDFDFALTHDAASGEFTLSLAGGPSTTWSSGRPDEAVQEIWFLAKTSNADYTSTVKNLALDGSPISTDLVAQNNKTYLKIYGESFADFNLQGTMNFSWAGGTPNGSHIEALISLTSFAPIQNGSVLLEDPSKQYTTLQLAYDAAYNDEGLTDGTFRIQAGTPIREFLIFDKEISVALLGGYDDTFENVISYTIVDGTVTISAGTVTVSNLIIGPS